jgi:hypothetical protein
LSVTGPVAALLEAHAASVVQAITTPTAPAPSFARDLR